MWEAVVAETRYANLVLVRNCLSVSVSGERGDALIRSGHTPQAMRLSTASNSISLLCVLGISQLFGHILLSRGWGGVLAEP